jgi:hypothetical protein
MCELKNYEYCTIFLEYNSKVGLQENYVVVQSALDKDNFIKIILEKTKGSLIL